MFLVLIFAIALAVRFIYFPNDVYFGYDQARDSYASLEVLKGNFKIIGPPTTASDKIFHGALFYYIWAPIYFLSNHNPEAVAALMRVFNALGVFLVFYIAKNLFNPAVGLVAAFFYAISFEQSQYSLFLGHPSFGVVTALVFYLGLTLWIFGKQKIGFILTLLGLGLTLQFEDANILLVLVLIALSAIFRKSFKILDLKTIILGVFTFILSVLTFILVEIKYQFRTTVAVLQILQSFDTTSKLNIGNFFKIIVRFVHDNLFFYDNLPVLIAIFLLVVWLILLRQGKQTGVFIFLGVWFFGGLLADLINNNFSYYYTPAATVSLLIFTSLLIYRLLTYKKAVALFILTLIFISNLYLIKHENYKGPNSDIVIQPGMLTSNQRHTLDYIYQKSRGDHFSVSAITVPLNVNTTWSYLFEWYGKSRYGYLPVWGSEAASGFYGNLQVETARSNLPPTRFLIVEPTVGIPDPIKEDFIKHENYFSKVLEEKKFGTIIVQHRRQI